MDAESLEPDPFVSAVVQIRADAPEATGGPPAADPHGVVTAAAAVLEGVDMGAEGLGPSAQGEPGAADVPGQGSAVAKAKGYFTKAGFEVHAPVGTSFSIGGRRSQFEGFFGQRLRVDEERLFSPVTTADGGNQLPLDAVPEEVRAMVESVSFPPPPELPTGLA